MQRMLGTYGRVSCILSCVEDRCPDVSIAAAFTPKASAAGCLAAVAPPQRSSGSVALRTRPWQFSTPHTRSGTTALSPFATQYETIRHSMRQQVTQLGKTAVERRSVVSGSCGPEVSGQLTVSDPLTTCVVEKKNRVVNRDCLQALNSFPGFPEALFPGRDICIMFSTPPFLDESRADVEFRNND